MNIEQITEIGIEALEEAKRVHDSLGKDGLEMVLKNQFGETALRADIEAEKAVLAVLKKHQTPIRVISEEHGVTNITENPVYLGILDGIDGTSVYKKARNTGRYATMFGVANNLNPRYKDYIFSGIMVHASNLLYWAVKGQGAYFDREHRNNVTVRKQLQTSGKISLNEHTRIYLGDDYNETARQNFKGRFPDFWTKSPLSAAISYVDIASGQAELEAEVTRKQNLEQMIAYGLIKEAGGVMVTLDGQDIGSKKYLEFGQKESVPLITAASLELALDCLRKTGLLNS